MVWALAVIAVLGVGVPVGAWSYTRLRPLPPVSRLGTGYDPIDRWLLEHHGLPPLDRERVRVAVFQGRQVDDPALAPAAYDLAAKVLTGGFRVLRLSPLLEWANMFMAIGFAATGIGLLITSRHADGVALGILALFDGSMFTFAGVMQIRQAKRIQHNATMARQLNQDHR